MEKFDISVKREDEIIHYQVVNMKKDHCEFEVYEDGNLVASFEPTDEEYIKICRNPGGLDEELIFLIADHIEAHHL